MSSKNISGRVLFFLLVLGLAILRILISMIRVPGGALAISSIGLTIIFVAVPIFAVFQAAKDTWPKSVSWSFLLGGALVHTLGALLLRSALEPGTFLAALVLAIVQGSIAFWTLGLGGIVTGLIKDKNLILPVALVLAGLDMFLVFDPGAPTAKIVRQNPQLFQSMAYQVPKMATTVSPQTSGFQVAPQAFVGPADLLFIAVFLIALTQYKMKVAQTLRWLMPVMVGYLILVLLPIGLNMLPALVPIGGTVLLVNRREFEMSSQEKAMTWGAGILALGLALTGLVRHFTVSAPIERPEPSQKPSVRGLPGSGSSLETEAPN